MSGAGRVLGDFDLIVFGDGGGGAGPFLDREGDESRCSVVVGGGTTSASG